jgi:ferredoxin
MLESAQPPRIVLTVTLGDAPGDAIAAEPGDTLLAALRRAAIGIRSICGGRCACGTCRVAIAEGWVDRLPAPSRNEARLLRALPGAGPAHRLACQITLDAMTEGLAFRLDTPPGRAPAETLTAKATETTP